MELGGAHGEGEVNEEEEDESVEEEKDVFGQVVTNSVRKPKAVNGHGSVEMELVPVNGAGNALILPA